MEISREVIINFIRDHHKETGEAPTLREITEGFNMSSKTFYKVFSGISEACRASGVPVPEKRRDTTSEATKIIKRRSSRQGDQNASGSLVSLTQEQVGRLLGLSHLEGGKDPRVVLDEMLDRDTQLRSLLEKPENLGQTVEALNALMRGGFKFEELGTALGRLGRLGILNYPRETLEGLAEIVTSLRLKGLKIDEFVRDAADAESSLHWFFKYKNSEITAREYAARAGVRL
jgi:hypothetical protein